MIKKKSLINKSIYLYLIGLLPFALLTGTLLPEILIIFLILSFIYEVLINKNFIPFKNHIFIFLIIIWIYLIFNYTISSDKLLSFSRTFSFIRFPLLILSINYFLKENDYCDYVGFVNKGFFQYSFPPSPVYPITKLPARAASAGGSGKPSILEKDKNIFDSLN